MAKRVLNFINHYKLWVLAILGILLLIAHHYLEIAIFNRQHSTFLDPPDFLYIYPMRILLALIFLITAYILILNIYYTDHTGGRSLWRDRRDYNRTSWELLRYYKDANPYRMNEKTLPIENWKNAEGVILGKKGNRLIKRSSSESGGDGANFLLFALPGDGKTTSQIIPSALRFGGSVLAIDIKGDIYKATHTHRRIKIFSPDNPSESCTFNPLYGIENMSLTERKALIEQFAEIVVKDDKNGKYFVDGGRDCFCGIALYLLEKDISTTFPEIIKAILSGNAISWITEIYNSDCTAAQEYTNSYYGTNEVNVSGAYGEMRKRIRTLCTDELMQLLVPDEESITPTALEAGYDIYIEIPQNKVKFYAPITTILVQRFMSSFMERPDKATGLQPRPILFLLDEFPQLLFAFDTLSAALSTLRSKGIFILMAMQSIAQPCNRYGADCFREIVDTCAYISIMSAQDPESRTFFQRLIGTEKKLVMSSNEGSSTDSNNHTGSSSSRGANETRDYIFQPEDFANLGNNLVIYAKGKYIVAEKTFYYK